MPSAIYTTALSPLSHIYIYIYDSEDDVDVDDTTTTRTEERGKSCISPGYFHYTIIITVANLILARVRNNVVPSSPFFFFFFRFIDSTIRKRETDTRAIKIPSSAQLWN